MGSSTNSLVPFPKSRKRQCRLLTDAIEKGFAKDHRAISIQDQAQIRNLDSKKGMPRFDNFKIQFYSSILDTFSTASTHSDFGQAYGGSEGRTVRTEPSLPAERIATLRTVFNPMLADGEFLDEICALKLDFRPLKDQETAVVIRRLFAAPRPPSKNPRLARRKIGTIGACRSRVTGSPFVSSRRRQATPGDGLRGGRRCDGAGRTLDFRTLR